MGRGRARQRAREPLTSTFNPQDKAQLALRAAARLFTRAVARRPLPLTPSRKGREESFIR
jgi:hypothetical protein